MWITLYWLSNVEHRRSLAYINEMNNSKVFCRHGLTADRLFLHFDSSSSVSNFVASILLRDNNNVCGFIGLQTANIFVDRFDFICFKPFKPPRWIDNSLKTNLEFGWTNHHFRNSSFFVLIEIGRMRCIEFQIISSNSWNFSFCQFS